MVYILTSEHVISLRIKKLQMLIFAFLFFHLLFLSFVHNSLNFSTSLIFFPCNLFDSLLCTFFNPLSKIFNNLVLFLQPLIIPLHQILHTYFLTETLRRMPFFRTSIITKFTVRSAFDIPPQITDRKRTGRKLRKPILLSLRVIH